MKKQILINGEMYEMRTSKFCLNESPVIVSDNMSGKMSGFPSISTSPIINEYCQMRKNIPGAVCGECFSMATVARYKALGINLETNTRLLTGSILPLEMLPVFGNVRAVRFESFGDLNNATQFINYMNICKVNPCITFSIWTKNPLIIKEAITMGYEKPNNLIILFSSCMINKKVNDTIFKLFPFVDKVFTVYNEKTIIEQNITVNCGARSCASCFRCYDFNNHEKQVIEKLK